MGVFNVSLHFLRVLMEIICNFADMNSDLLYLLLLCFVSGLTQGALLCLSIYLIRQHCDYLFQQLFAAVLIMHSFGFFNNFVVSACQDLSCSTYLNTLLILYDYMIVGGKKYMNENAGGKSTFTVQIPDGAKKVEVTADTTAMSQSVKRLREDPALLDKKEAVAPRRTVKEQQEAPFIQSAIDNLTRHLGTQVKILPGKKRSRIQIDFAT